MCKWCARRGHLEGKIEHFDANFRRPFIVFMVLAIIGFSFLIIGTLLIKHFAVEAT